MDLSNLSAAKVELIDVPLVFDDEGEPTDGFKCVGSNSDEYQNAEREWQLTNLKKAARRGRGIDASTQNGAVELADALHRQELALTKACIKEIYGFTTNGQPASLNDETLNAIFKARPTWVGKTLAEIRMDRGFTKP